MNPSNDPKQEVLPDACAASRVLHNTDQKAACACSSSPLNSSFGTSQEHDSTPRRGYTPGVPAAYRVYRNHVIEHLRRHLSFEQMRDARWGEFSWSPTEVSFGSKKVVSDRNVVEVLEAFLEKRHELAGVIPALLEPEAFLLPALDGGRLVVSHRPRGMSDTGLLAFVSSRDALFSFVFHYFRENDVRSLMELSMHELTLMKDRLRVKPHLQEKFQLLSDTYLEQREVWIGKVADFAKTLRLDQGVRGVGRVINEMLEKPELSSEDQVRLKELSDIKAIIEQEVARRRRLSIQPRPRKNIESQGPLLEDAEENLNEQEITPEAMPVYYPNPRTVFLGTDGGAFFGDTGQSAFHYAPPKKDKK